MDYQTFTLPSLTERANDQPTDTASNRGALTLKTANVQSNPNAARPNVTLGEKWYLHRKWLSSFEKKRPDTRLPKSRAGGQGPYLRSLYHW